MVIKSSGGKCSAKLGTLYLLQYCSVHRLFFAYDQVIIAEDPEDAVFMLRKLKNSFKYLSEQNSTANN